MKSKKLYVLEGETNTSSNNITTIREDEEGIWSLIKTNKHWLSLSVYEVSDVPIYSQNRYQRPIYLHDIEMKKQEAEERELYLKLKEKYEKNTNTTATTLVDQLHRPIS